MLTLLLFLFADLNELLSQAVSAQLLGTRNKNYRVSNCIKSWQISWSYCLC